MSKSTRHPRSRCRSPASPSPEITEHAEGEDANESAEYQAEGADTPISDQDALKTASEKALAWLKTEHGATGTVSDTEVGDEESYYEIEVTLEVLGLD